MGYAIAAEAARRGAEVTLVSGPVLSFGDASFNKGCQVESAMQMLAVCEEAFPQSDIAVMTAAVADYAPSCTGKDKA